MPKCSMNNCKNNTSRTLKKHGISYFRFPCDPIRCAEWTSIVSQQRCEYFFKPNKSSVVCSKHFSDNDLYATAKGRKRLVKMAVPCVTRADAGSSSRKVGAPSAGTRLPEAEKIIASVYRYLQSEYDNLKSSIGGACDLTPLANILKRTAAATGVSKRTVTGILELVKRPANSEVDTAQNKRTKFIPTFEDEDVSSIEEESSCGSPADVEEPDEDEEEEEDQYDSIETLKVELDEEDEDHSEDMEKKIRVDLASCEKTSTVHHLLSPAQTEVKIESQDLGYRTSSALHHLLSSTRVEIQHEPSDVLHRQAGHIELQTAPDATLDPVKTEPWDNDTDAGHAVLQTAPDATFDPVKTEPWDDDTDT